MRLSGSTTWITNLHKGLLLAGAEVVHVVTSDEGEICPDVGRVIYMGRARGAPALRVSRWLQVHKALPDLYRKIEAREYCRRSRKVLRELQWDDRVDLVIKDFTSRLPAEFSRFPVVSVIHEELSITAGKWLAEAKAQRARHFVPVSRLAGQDAASLGIRVTEPIYNPIDVLAVREKSDAFPAPLERPYIVYVGKLNRGKGVHELLAAFSALPEAVDLVYVGRGEESDKLRTRAEELGLSSRVHLVGFQANPYPYIRHARALILPSSTEAMPYVLFEAGALGVPVVVARFNAAGEFLDEDVIVDRSPESDFPQRLAERIAASLSGSLGLGVKAGVLESMNPAAVASRYLALADRG